MKITLLLILAVCLALIQPACRSGQDSSDAGANSSGDSEDPQALLKQAIDLYSQNKDREAVDTFERAIKIKPDFPEAYFRLGLAYAALGERENADNAYRKAVEEFDKYLRSHRDDGNAYYLLGMAHTKLENDVAALRAFREAARLKPDDNNVFYELGLAYKRLIQYRDAVVAFEKAVELDPDDYRSSDALERTREDMKRWNTLVKQQESAIKREKEKAKEKENTEGDSQSSPGTKPDANKP